MTATMNALYNERDRIQFVQVRHEGSGAIAAAPKTDLVERAVQLLRNAKAPLLYFGRGARTAHGELPETPFYRTCLANKRTLDEAKQAFTEALKAFDYWLAQEEQR